jgi:sugar phosphate permease
MAPLNTRIFRGWSVVAVIALIIGFSGQVFIATGFTILASALVTAFSWPASSVALGATLFLLAQVTAYPVCGRLIDRFGSRQVAATGFLMFGLLLWATSRVSALGEFHLAMAALGFVSTMTNPVTYLRTLSLWFERRRGLAIGLAAGGMSMGAALIPLGMQAMIQRHDWSASLQALAAVHLLFCLPLVLWLLHDEPGRFGLRPDGVAGPAGHDAQHAPALDGVSTTAAVRRSTFHLLAFVYFATGLAAFGVLVNAAQVLKQTAGLDMGAIARTQALVGASVLLGRVMVGGLLDRVDARLIGAVMCVTTAIAVLGYAHSTTATTAMASALLLGLSIGGESDVLPYLAARYFGVRSFGTIAGLLAASSTLGGALAPVVFAGLAAASHSVTLPLYVFSAVLVLSALAFTVMAPPPSSAKP